MPKDEEILVKHPNSVQEHEVFLKNMQKAMEECRRVLMPNGLGVVIFAHKSTSGWEAQLDAMLSAGWIITASWPLNTELVHRLIAEFDLTSEDFLLNTFSGLGTTLYTAQNESTLSANVREAPYIN